MTTTFAERMKQQGLLKINEVRKSPLWEGPQSNGRQGGVTVSLLSRYVSCAERFRIKTIEGLERTDSFNHHIEFGNMWHACEESHAAGKDHVPALTNYAKKLNDKYRMSGDEIDKWFNVCRVQFPIYDRHWAKHPDIKGRKPLLQEYVFKVPYILPSGRTVYLRGKMDSVDSVKNSGSPEIWLQENKGKSDINEQQIVRQLTFDLQTMLYLEVLSYELGQETKAGYPKGQLAGVRYNVIRRPLSGGRHSIVQKKPSKANPKGQSKEEFYQELSERIAGEPEYFFMRWNVRIGENDLQRFRTEFLNPCLENLCDDYEWWADRFVNCKSPWDYLGRLDLYGNHRHYRLPYGIYNPVAEGVIGDYDEYLSSGSTLGLKQATDLFKELNDA